MANDLPAALDSVLARYAGPVQVGVSGDPQVASRYVGLARVGLGQLRNALALGGIADGARHFILPDGAKISVLRIAGMDLVRIDVTDVETTTTVEEISRFFLESGFIHITGKLVIAEDEPVGWLFYAERVKDVYDRWNDADAKFADHSASQVPWLDWLDVMTKNGTGVFSNGDNPYRWEVRDYEPGMVSEAVTVGAEGQAKQLAWLLKDIAAATGKMKLLLQCQLGRYHINGVEMLESYGATPTLFSTYGVLTLSNYRYALIRVSMGSVFWKPLEVNEDLRRMLVRQVGSIAEEDRQRLESYLLATARVGDSVWTEVDLSDNTVKGTPFYYGWKGNWAGDQWAVVTNEPIYDGARIVFHTSRLYTIELTPHLDDDGVLTNVTGSFSKEEEQNYTMRVGVDLIWYPSPGLNEMIPFIPVTSALVQYPKLLYGDAPVYCWFDDGDELVQIRHSLNMEPAKTTYDVEIDFANENVYGVYWSVYNDGTRLCAPNRVFFDDWKSPNDYLKGGFYMKRGDDDHTDSKEFTVGDSVINKTSYMSISDFSASGSSIHYGSTTSIPICDPPDAADYWVDHLSSWVSSNLEMVGDLKTTSSYIDSVCVIPFSSSESAFLIARQRETGVFDFYKQLGTADVQGTSLEGGTSVVSHTMYWRKVQDWGGWVHILTDFYTSGTLGKSEVKGWLFAKNRDTVKTMDDFVAEYRTDLRYDYNSSANRFITSVDTEEEIATGTADDLGILADLFDPNMFGGDISTFPKLILLESVSGDLYYPETIRDREEAVNDDRLPLLGYNGLFSGWA